jgi:hypothetical protein
MTALAETAGDEAIAEAAAQSVTIEPLDMDELAADISARAAAQSTVMARSIGQAASQKAITEAGTGIAMTEVAERVGTYLIELSDSYLHDQLGGVMTQAQNTARRAVFDRGAVDQAPTDARRAHQRVRNLQPEPAGQRLQPSSGTPQGNRTTFQVLEEFRTTGNMAFLARWTEFEQASHRRRQLTASRGLFDR